MEEFLESRFVIDNEDANTKTQAYGVVTVALRQRTTDEIRAYGRNVWTQASLSPVQLLFPMKSVVAQAIPRLEFDCFHLHRSCHMVLDAT